MVRMLEGVGRFTVGGKAFHLKGIAWMVFCQVWVEVKRDGS